MKVQCPSARSMAAAGEESTPPDNATAMVEGSMISIVMAVKGFKEDCAPSISTVGFRLPNSCFFLAYQQITLVGIGRYGEN